MAPGPIRPAAATAPPESSLADRLVRLPAGRREETLREIVLIEVARVLGHRNPDLVDPERGLQEMGFDSLTAVELRTRLTAATSLPLPATLVFDYPTVTALAAHLLGLLVPAGEPAAESLAADLDRLGAALTDVPEPERAEIDRRLRQLLRRWQDAYGTGGAEDLGAVTDDELFLTLDEELGLPGD